VVGNHWLQGIGLACFAFGLAFAVWARVYIGRNWGTPMSQKKDPELVTSGPYRWVRHPIYSGIILAMIGTAVGLSPVWLLLVAIVGGYFVYSATQEERYMTQQFPDTYPAYRRSSKMLIPFLF
jgi:protein-S-isoprenylcysteine O-methyltransferase Ste14